MSYSESLDFYDAVGKNINQLSDVMCEKFGYSYAAGFFPSFVQTIAIDYKLDLTEKQKKRVLELIADHIDYIENKA